jgi:iron complex transport system ATP-binding protein
MSRSADRALRVTSIESGARLDGVTLQATGISLRAGGAPRGRLLVAHGDVTVEPTERWVVLGPNGAGKSSLLAALAGIFALDRGRVCIDGRALDAWPPRALAHRRAWCPQFWSDPFPASVRETLELATERGRWWPVGGGKIDPAIDVCIDRLDLRGLEGADVRTLSGGERQRVALGTTLLQGAALLLLDEPASHLDLRHRRLLLDVLLEHAQQGGSVVACMHDLDLAWALATHAVLLDGRGGCIAGPRDDVMTAAHIGAAFDIAVEAIQVAGERHFAMALAARSTA